MSDEINEIENQAPTTQEQLDEALANTETTEEKKAERIVLGEDGVILIDQREYRLVENYRDAFDLVKMNERYSDILNRYDYIVGDIGFEQLRLKGFFGDHQHKMPMDTRIGALQDYLYEYCNFGCAYFVLELVGGGEIQTGGNRNNQNRNRKNNRKNKPQTGQQPRKEGQPTAHLKEKQGRVAQAKPNQKAKPQIKNRRDAEPKTNRAPKAGRDNQSKPQTGGRHFTIRQTDEATKGE